jgi:hypothetical protein
VNHSTAVHYVCGMSVCRVMCDVLFVSPRALQSDKDIACVVVVDDKNKLAGLFTAKDFLRTIVSCWGAAVSTRTHVGQGAPLAECSFQTWLGFREAAMAMPVPPPPIPPLSSPSRCAGGSPVGRHEGAGQQAHVHPRYLC